MKKIDENFNKILDAARDIFSRFGFRKTTMDEIAKAVHMGKSSIYYYFPGKEDVFKAVVDKEALLFREELIKKISSEKTAKDKLHTYIMFRMMKLSELASFYEAIRADYLSHFSFIEEIRSKYDKEESHLIQNILIEGKVKGEFSSVDEPELAATAITIAMKGLEYPLLISERKDDAELMKKIEKLLDILFYGIVKVK
jgi:AcrR family transcriptional regulator